MQNHDCNDQMERDNIRIVAFSNFHYILQVALSILYIPSISKLVVGNLHDDQLVVGINKHNL